MVRSQLAYKIRQNNQYSHVRRQQRCTWRPPGPNDTSWWLTRRPKGSSSVPQCFREKEQKTGVMDSCDNPDSLSLFLLYWLETERSGATCGISGLTSSEAKVFSVKIPGRVSSSPQSGCGSSPGREPTGHEDPQDSLEM